MLGRLDARRAGTRRGGAEPGAPPRAGEAGAGPGAAAAAATATTATQRTARAGAASALSRRRGRPPPPPLSPPPPPRPPPPASAFVTRRGAPGRGSPGQAAAPRDLGQRAGGGPPSLGPPPRARAGAQARAGGAPPPFSLGPGLPHPRVSGTHHGGALSPGQRAGAERVGGGQPLKIQRDAGLGDGEKQRRPSAAHLACQGRAARLPRPETPKATGTSKATAADS